MDKETYRIITEIWQFLKKYIPVCTSNAEEVWDSIREDCTRIYASTSGQPGYFRAMAEKMLVAACELLEGIYKEGQHERD